VLVLASESRHRAELLRRLNLPFSQLAPDIDESSDPDEAPATLAARLALTKAKAVAAALRRALVDTATQPPTSRSASLPSSHLIIASDQVAALGQQRLRKPGTELRAVEQLTAMSGTSVHFYTALCLLDSATGRRFEALDTTVAHLRTLSAAEVTRYVKVEQPLDCAGSFKVESLGISLFESIDSQDPSALVGLPMIKLCDGLRQFGVAVP
jgi:septum formation protein